MKESKVNPIFLLPNKVDFHTRNKSLKLNEIKNLYTINLNKSINGALKTPSPADFAVKLLPLETECNSKVGSSNQQGLNFIRHFKKKSTEIVSKLLSNNCFSNYLTNSKCIKKKEEKRKTNKSNDYIT